LNEVARYYNDVIDVNIGRFTTLLGPIVLVGMTFVIGVIILGMFLPIFKLSTLGIGGSGGM
ncbi:MAG: hypothetical protein PHS37_01690, partial [Candidatus Omnitrophica bacterium]|nr:hypothetical protein [Candidatus Omnitrophota bacterium]